MGRTYSLHADAANVRFWPIRLKQSRAQVFGCSPGLASPVLCEGQGRRRLHVHDEGAFDNSGPPSCGRLASGSPPDLVTERPSRRLRVSRSSASFLSSSTSQGRPRSSTKLPGSIVSRQVDVDGEGDRSLPTAMGVARPMPRTRRCNRGLSTDCIESA